MTTRQYTKARKRLEKGKASEFIQWLHPLAAAQPGLRVVTYARESTKNQNLAARKAELKEAVEELGCEIVASFAAVEPSWPRMDWPPRGSADGARGVKLFLAIQKAREMGAVLVAMSRDRFIRAPWYGDVRRHKFDPPPVYRYREFKELVGDCIVATVLDPDTPTEKVRSIQINKGQASGSKGGRPKKTPPGAMKARRLEQQPEVRELRAEGKSLRQIAELTGVPLSTVRRWLL